MSNKVYTYSYNSKYDPPMPVIELTLSLPGQADSEANITALIDSGSDGTLIPIDILEKMGARYVDRVRIRSIFGDTELADRYLVNVRIGNHFIYAVRVVAVSNDDEIILGRNILNQLLVTLNGLASVTEIPD